MSVSYFQNYDATEVHAQGILKPLPACQRVSDDDPGCSLSGSVRCLTDGALFDEELSIIFTVTIRG